MIARLAARQHGVLARRQLLEAGLDGHEIDYRVKIGRLVRVHRGVYATGHLPTSPLARAAAAVLACGSGALLSHRSAAALWKIARWPSRIEVSVRSYRHHPGIRIHRSTSLLPQDATVHYGIPVTTPARTLLDLADTLEDAALTRAVNDARLCHYLSLDDLAELLTRSPGRAVTRLRPFVEHATGPTRSEFEDAFLAFTERYGLPRPEADQTVAGYEVDMLWREQRLIVELDSRLHHDSDEPFEIDRDRDADLLAAGFPVVRVTWRRLVQAPAREARRLEALLAR